MTEEERADQPSDPSDPAASSDNAQTAPAPEAYHEGDADRSESNGKNGIAGLLKLLDLNQWLTLVVAVVAACASVQSCRIAEDSSDLQNAVSGLTDLARQSARQASATDRQVAILSQESNMMQSEVSEMGEQTGALKSQAENSLEIYRSQYRPKFLLSFEPITGYSPNSVPIGGMEFYNKGNDPVFDVQLLGGIRFLVPPKTPDFSGFNHPGFFTTTTVYPDGMTSIKITASGPVSQGNIADISAGRAKMFIIGRAAFTDALGKRHHAYLCGDFFSGKDVTEGTACHTPRDD